MAQLVRYESTGDPFNGASILDVFYSIEKSGNNYVLRHQDVTAKDFPIGNGLSAKTGIVDDYKGYVYMPPVGGPKLPIVIDNVSFLDSLNSLHKLIIAAIAISVILSLIFFLK